MTESRTYTPDEYAVKMKVSVKTIYRQIRAGTLKAERVGHQWRIVRLVVSSAPSRHSA
jgi:excisionase family DNA binding protein